MAFMEVGAVIRGPIRNAKNMTVGEVIQGIFIGTVTAGQNDGKLHKLNTKEGPVTIGGTGLLNHIIENNVRPGDSVRITFLGKDETVSFKGNHPYGWKVEKELPEEIAF